jgi:hypothetical protein
MPAKPAWYSDLDAIIRELQALPRPFVDRATIESLLGVGRRRAQQIMGPCITHHVGANGLADRDLLITHLRGLARSDDVSYEQIRRRKVAGLLDGLRKDRLERPQLLVEAPMRVVNQEMDALPRGVRIESGRIIVEFEEPRQALEKLLALAMAIGNDYETFERLAGGGQS